MSTRFSDDAGAAHCRTSASTHRTRSAPGCERPRSRPTAEKSTAVTSQPSDASHSACRPSPDARSTAVPGGRFPSSSATRAFGPSDHCRRSSYRASQSSARTKAVCRTVVPACHGERVTTLADIGPLRLAAQRLVGDRESTPRDAVRRLLAVQAQDLPGALTSVALRTVARSRAEVVAALDSGEVVRSWPMRGTLHLVAADDLPWMLDVLGSRTLGGVAKRWAGLELDEVQAERARECVLAALEQRDRAGRAELLEAIAAGGVATTGQRGYHLLWYLSQTGTLCMGPTDGDGDQLYVLLDRWIAEPRRLGPDEAHSELALRFFTGHGPATVPDLVRWSGSTAGRIRAGLAEVRDRLESVSVDGTEYLMDPSTPERLAAARREA